MNGGSEKHSTNHMPSCPTESGFECVSQGLEKQARSLCSDSLERKPPQTSKYIETANAHISSCFLFGSNLSIGNSESSKGIHICTTMLLAITLKQ